MVEIKPLSVIAKKWQKNASASSDEYREGVKTTRKDWEALTIAADDARKEGLQAADARDAFVKGVARAGTQKWRDRSVKFGPARYRQGVAGSEAEYASGFSNAHSVIAGVTLPPRGPAGSPENHDRSRIIGDALHEDKISR